MTLAGLTIAIGRVIDDSIVVLDNVYSHMAEGEPSFAAIINGARDAVVIVVGSHGLGSSPERLMGRTAGWLSHHSDRPVIILPSTASWAS